MKSGVGKVFKSRRFASIAADKYARQTPGFAYKLRKEGTQWRVIPQGKG